MQVLSGGRQDLIRRRAQDVYVVTSGGLGSVGIASAEQTGGMVTFNFAVAGVCPGQTSYFFGLTSATTTRSRPSRGFIISLGGRPRRRPAFRNTADFCLRGPILSAPFFLFEEHSWLRGKKPQTTQP